MAADGPGAERLRRLCLSLPDAREVEAWGAPTFRVKTIFAMYSSPESGHGPGREDVWIKAPAGDQDFLVHAEPDRYFVPPYVGPKGWVGAVLDEDTDWPRIETMLREAWAMSSPKRLVAEHAESLGL